MIEDVVDGEAQLVHLVCLNLSRRQARCRCRKRVVYGRVSQQCFCRSVEHAAVAGHWRGQIGVVVAPNVVAEPHWPDVVRRRLRVECIGGGVRNHPTREHASKVGNFRLSIGRNPISVGVEHRRAILIEQVGAD